MSSLAPKIRSNGSIKNIPIMTTMHAMIKFNNTTLDKIFFASFAFLPNRSENNAAAPTPTIDPNAEIIFIIGNATPKPAIAIGPTPFPIKILSVKLYSDVADVAIMAGSENRSKSFQIRSFAKSSGVI